MTGLSARRSPACMAFDIYLRTGLRIPESVFAERLRALETKFNPYHDPQNGQFTFGPGGGASLSDGVYHPAAQKPALLPTAGSEPPRGMGDNRPPPDPLVLADAFPGLKDAPAGAIVAAADPFLDLTGPSSAMTSEMSLAYSKNLIAQIQAIDPSYRYDSLGFPDTFDGQMRMIDDLRWDRAAAIYNKTGNTEPLQLETIRFLQARTDLAYDKAIEAKAAGELPASLNDGMAIGNYVDKATRSALREQFQVLAISTGKGEQVRVNAREYDSSRDTSTYSRPDARIGKLALDVTLQQKTAKAEQIVRFFGSDFKPVGVAIVRPRQVDPVGTYMINRPEK